MHKFQYVSHIIAWKHGTNEILSYFHFFSLYVKSVISMGLENMNSNHKSGCKQCLFFLS